MARDDFNLKTKDSLARRVGMRCSNPNCRQPTSGPEVDPQGSINVGVAAHITAASPGGSRYDPSLSTEQRQSIENAIWLCQNCAKLVDNDPLRYAVPLLQKWKTLSEAAALLAIEGGPSKDENWREAEDNEWADKFTEAIQYLGNVIPRFFTGVPGPPPAGRPGGSGYGLVFPDLQLRQNIEAHLIDLVSPTKMKPRSLSTDQLRLRIVRETIQKVLDRVEEVKRTDSELATRLQLT
jgi:hypothetical protein